MFQKGKKNPHSGGLNIMIVGCGKVGMTLVDRLSKEGHDISVVDKNAARLQSVTHMHDVYGVVGNGASFTVLKEAGIENTDILISVTDSDELNLLCCLVAKRSGHCEVIARVRTPDYSEEKAYLKEKLGLAMMINPEQEAANAISRILYMPTALEVAPFARGHAEMVRIKLPQAIIVNGDGTSEELLNEIGITTTESLVPLTGIDEENIMLTLYAKEVSNAKVVTKINRITYTGVIDQLDLGSVVYPKYITSEAIIAFVRSKTATMNNNIETMIHLFDERVEAIEFVVGDQSPIVNLPLAQLKLKKNLLVACINRDGKIIIPGGNDKIQGGDTVIIVTTNTGFHDIEDILR